MPELESRLAPATVPATPAAPAGTLGTASPDGVRTSAAAPAPQARSADASRLTPAQRLKRLAAKAVGREVYSSARSVYKLARWGQERHEPFSLRHKAYAWSHGFLSFSTALYDLPRNDPREYVNDFTRLFRASRINPAPQFLDHKFLLRSVLLGKGFPQPETVALVYRSDILIHPFDGSNRYLSPADLDRWLIEDGGAFIVKPQDGRCGRDVFLVEVRDGALVRRRGKDARPFQFAGRVRNDILLVERRVEQGAFWRTLYPESSNTIRALTMWVPGDEAPFLAAAAQRIGTADTMPTDNFSGGGIAAPIDLATGRLGTGSRHPVKARGMGAQQRGITHHPDTGVPIEGAVLPHWERLRDSVLRAAASLPTNRYVGWDIIVDDTGAPVIIEGNARPGLDVVQTHRGLLADPEARRFYEKCGVL